MHRLQFEEIYLSYQVKHHQIFPVRTYSSCYVHFLCILLKLLRILKKLTVL